ncbi:acetyltransferase, GNAT family [Verrucomicrobiia bacterium DG1235]|nr:acetyltransferase, GNAT family [Verrucomicrobiae bacterium DG1235]
MEIRASSDSDLTRISDLETTSFGPSEGPIITVLVNKLLDDPTAQPRISLAACEIERLTGHILFTNAKIEGAPQEISASILAPLAVLPERQRAGIGKRLVTQGLKRLAEEHTDLVFVLGHPGYYPRFGFSPAGSQGLEAPYPIPRKNADAWMVLFLNSKLAGKIQGRVLCSNVLAQPEYWRE